MSDRSVLYVYPMWHRVSFSIVAQKHIEYMRRSWGYTVYEIDELAFPSYVPSVKHRAVVHPMLYIMHRVLEARKDITGRFRKEYYDWWRSNYDQLIGVDVCDSDRMSEYAVFLSNLMDKVVVPSRFCVDVFRNSGVKTPVYSVPHGVDPDWYTVPNVWESMPPSRIHPALLQIYLFKLRKRKKIILFWLWHCYDEQTRVLTKEGFKYWWELKPDDEIATFNMETGELEYQKPERIIVFDYEGEMIHFEGQHYDLLVTPNHRMIVRDSYHYVKHSLGKSKRSGVKHDVVDPVRPWKVMYAEDLYNYLMTHSNVRRFEIPRAVRWRGKYVEYFELPDVDLDPNYPVWVLDKVPNKPRIVKRVPMKAFLRFLGWWIAEGSARYSVHNQEYEIIIWNKNPEYVKEIVETVKEMGFEPVVQKRKRRTEGCESDDYVYEVIICSKQLYMTLKKLGLPVHPEVKGSKARIKFVPSFVKELASELIMEFLKALWKGDGTFDKKGNFVKYCTTSKKLAEDVAELLLKCGYAVTIFKERNRERYYVCPSKRYAFPTTMKPPKKVYYKGKVWCVTVPNGAIIVERNGKIVISGNSGWRKGWNEVREVYRRIRKERDDVVLVLKTGIPNPIEYQQVMDLGAINVYGWLSDVEKMALYDLADVVLNFSYGGAFELNCLEALSRGVPCIASDYGSWTEYVPPWLQVKRGKRVQPLPGNKLHVGYGYTVDVNDALNKLHHILDNLDDYKARVLEWREKVLRNTYRWDVVAKRLIDVIEA